LWVKAPPEERNEEAKHMATAARRRTSTSVSLAQRIAGGIVGGIVGGLVFGAMMAMMGMLPMVASVVGSKSALIGFLYHMFNSAIIGALFGLIFGQLSYAYGQGVLFGLIYGAIWWVLGPLILMPLLLGMGTPQFAMAFTQPMLLSLVGHLVYGLITGVVYVWYVHWRAGVNSTGAAGRA
jgi:hypothetical protein